jgi:hypothetical protein
MERMVWRDRIHPPIILSSVGNEEWAIENNELGTRFARELRAILRQMDPTRSSTLAASSSGEAEGFGGGLAGDRLQRQGAARHRHDAPSLPRAADAADGRRPHLRQAWAWLAWSQPLDVAMAFSTSMRP